MSSVAPSRVVITGASSGLGRALSLSYAAPGVSLILLGRDRQRLEDVARQCSGLGARPEVVLLDVAEGEALCTLLQALDAAAPIDLLIANAGILTGPPKADALDGVQAASSLININLLGVVNAVEALAPAMIDRRRGQIAVIASTASYRGLPYFPAYAASKAGIRIYGEAVRARLSPYGVQVSVVTPSFFESPMTDRFDGATPMMISLEDAARRVRKGLDKAAPRIVFPRRIGLLMQILDLIPARLGDALLRSDARIRPYDQ